MFLSAFTHPKFESVILDTSKNQNFDIKSSLSMRMKVGFVSKEAEKSSNNYENLRIRVVVGYTPHSCEAMDFISQRFNEYSNYQKENPRFMIETPSTSYTDFLRTDMKFGSDRCKDPFQFLQEINPLSPFSSKTEAVESIFTNGYGYQGDGNKLAAGTAIYDTLLMDAVDPSVANDIRSANYGNIGKEISIDPVGFKFKNITLKDRNQITVYAFVYDNKQKNNNIEKISLSTGMTNVASINLVGKTIRWQSNTPELPMVGIRSTTTETPANPSSETYIHLDFSYGGTLDKNATEKIDKNLYEGIRRNFSHNNERIQKIIKSENYFSNFWLTKDSEENHRFSFAFDLRSYLAENSMFPFLYQQPRLASMLINSHGVMKNEIPSYVLSMDVVRRFVDKLDLAPVNDLGTKGYSTSKGPSETYPDKTIRDLRQSKITLPDSVDQTENSGFVFYQGKDILNIPDKMDSRYRDGFKYGASCTVYDAAPVFMRSTLRMISRSRQAIKELYNTIMGTHDTPRLNVPSDQFVPYMPFYDTQNDNLAARLSEIRVWTYSLNHSNDSYNLQNGQEIVNGTLRNVVDLVHDFVGSSESDRIRDYYTSRFREAGGLFSVSYLREIISLLDMLFHLFYNRVSEVFPSDPLGRNHGVRKKIGLKSRGLLEFGFPLTEQTHFFHNKVVVGETYGLGCEYIQEKEQEPHGYKGLAHVSTQSYTTRTNEDIVKYFFSNTANVTDLSDFASSTRRYLTPKFIRVPYQQTINQMDYLSFSTGEMKYSCSDYAQLFVNIINHKNLVKHVGLVDPLIFDEESYMPKNERLYNTIRSVLGESFATRITDQSSFSYDMLDPKTSNKPQPTDAESLQKTKTVIGGPLAIPTIIGGQNNTDSSTLYYLNNVDTSLVSPYNIKKEGYTEEKRKDNKNPEKPILLPFAIFGELSVDSQMVDFIDYQKKVFNSMKNLCLMLGLDQDNIANVIVQPEFQDVPNSIKSMLILAATPESNEIGDSNVDASRPVLLEQDSGTNETLISFHLEGENTPPYQQTYDPMKKYAKFMAMWMNYKEISVIEYLASFNTVPEGVQNIDGEMLPINSPRLKLPVWRKMNPNIIDSLSGNEKIICRVRKYSAQEYLQSILTTKMRSYNNTYGDGFLSNEDIFDLPIYNQYFILGAQLEPSEKSEPKTQEGTTTEKECHNHTYNIDPKGNGWTSYAVHPENPNVRHRHQIINYVVQSAASDCYPNCEIQHGIKGAPPHDHEILTTEENEETQQIQGVTSMESGVGNGVSY